MTFRLSDDHEAVGEIFDQLLTALKDRNPALSLAKLDLLWARLGVHIRAEHLHLFPAVITRLDEAQSVVDGLRSDHDFFMREFARAIGILRELPRLLKFVVPEVHHSLSGLGVFAFID